MATVGTANDNSECGVKQAYRRVALRFDVNGNPYFDSVTSPESFKVCALGKLPPRHVIPVIFVPGIMGTNLCGNDKATKPGEPAWSPPNGKMAGLGEWFRRLRQSAAARQMQIGPDRVKVDNRGKVSIPRYLFSLTNDEAKRRGWGEIHFDSYGGILAALEYALNEPFIEPELPSDAQKPKEVWQVAQTLQRIVKDRKIDVRPEWGPQGVTIDPIAADEFSRVSQYYYPVWVCGYNCLPRMRRLRINLLNASTKPSNTTKRALIGFPPAKSSSLPILWADSLHAARHRNLRARPTTPPQTTTTLQAVKHPNRLTSRTAPLANNKLPTM